MDRVPQPFSTEFDTPDQVKEDHHQYDDLLPQLRQDISNSDRAAIRVVVGRAGIGKSWLFTALFNDLYDSFLDAKRGMRALPRPIPLLPEHLRRTHSVRTDALIDNFLRTDVADPMSSDTFVWLLVKDGLDELYAGDPGFFEYLVDLATTPNSRAQVTIWCRDSLLTTSREFSEFQDLCAGSDLLRIYRLDNWQRRSKRQFVWLRKEHRLPKNAEMDSNDVAKLLAVLDQNKAVKIMSALPLYCRILYEHAESNGANLFSDEVELLDHLIDSIRSREAEKGLLDETLFEEDGLDEWLEQIAADYVEGRYAGFQRVEAEEYATVVLKGGLSEDVERHILTSLLNYPLFQAGSGSGRVAFVHDLVADAVAARYYLKQLGRRPDELFDRLAHVDVDRPPLLRFMARRLDAEGRASLVGELRRRNKDRSFAVALTLLMLASPGREALARASVGLENRYLVGVRFSNLDLSRCSFRGSDLTYAAFHGCDLTGAVFESACLNRTAFDGGCELRDARFGSSRVQSIVVNGRRMDDSDRIHEWLSGASGTTTEGPCPTAQQFTHLFGKFVTPLGEARREALGDKALNAGKKYSGAASVADCIKEAVSAGYLRERDHRGRYSRASGREYAEIVQFVVDGRASDGIGRMLEELCPRPGCLHQL